jgi:hypothetical protein
MNNTILEERYRLSALSLEALNRLKSRRNADINENRQPKKDYSKLIFEEYDEDVLSLKLIADSIFYNVLIKRLDTIYESGIQQLFTNLSTTVRQIYEHINIKPRLYGFTESEVQNESQEILENKSVNLITEFFNLNYYSLTDEQIQNNYLKQVRPIAKELIISENIETQDAINFATKTIIVESLIDRISFPMIIKDRITDLIKSDDYGMIFDQDELINLWDSFSKQTRTIAKIIATVV